MAGPEKTIELQIVERLQDAGATVLYLQLTGGRGWPDVTAFANGKMVLIECKRLQGGKISKHQFAISEAMHDAGFTTYFANSVDICDLVLADLGLK
jgi:Holliday junction resolvase